MHFAKKSRKSELSNLLTDTERLNLKNYLQTFKANKPPQIQFRQQSMDSE